MSDNRTTVTIEGVQLIFRNFEGRADKFNLTGKREFSAKLDKAAADELIKAGFTVKYLTSREEGEPDQAYLPITVSFKFKPPRVVMIAGNTRTPLTEDTVATLDWVDIEFADLIVTPFHWDVNGKQGVSAYLKSLFVTIEESDLDRKYNQELGE